MTDDKAPYPVGYKKPPTATQFRPGQSGNSKGRPKGVKNFGTVLADELKTRIPVTENGKRKNISKREAIAKQMVNKAVAGDPKAIPIVLNEARLHDTLASSVAQQDVPMDQADHMVLDNFLKRLRGSQTPEMPGESALTSNPDASPSPQTEQEPQS